MIIDVDTIDGVKHEMIFDCNNFPYRKYAYGLSTCRGHKRNYYNIVATFDIETTTIKNAETPFGFMYLWQFCLGTRVCMGRRWEEFITFLANLKKHMRLEKSLRLVIYVHFLSFEFQFIRNFLDIESVFATDNRVVAKFDANNAFEFRCAWKLSNMSLTKFCENSKLCTYRKKDGEKYDYSVIRTANTILSNYELEYAYCDVRGLAQCIETLLIDDTLATIPLTSTGYVRRDCRKAMSSNPDNYAQFQQNRLSALQYGLLKQARRGGNTHANAIYSNEILSNIKSVDIVSSYPYVMLNCYFPISPFVQIGKRTAETLNDYCKDYCVLFEIVLENISFRDLKTIPYLPKAKCQQISNGRYDNGRVLSADRVRLTLTEIDYEIIKKQYDFTIIDIPTMFISNRGLLPKELRECVYDYFVKKTTLKGIDEYLYNRSKNKLNGIFGMMLTDIVHDEYIYNPSSEDVWSRELPDIDKALENHYKSHNAFLSYQHGVYVTAHARKRLQELLDIIGRDAVYCDTDSVKFFGDYDKEISEINKRVISTYCDDVPSYYVHNGKTHYLGIWETDAYYKKFKTLGAKKYAYVNEDDTFHITVAGLNKDKGAKYLKSIDNFNTDTTIPIEHSGRTVSYYNDCDKHYITIDGCKMLTASNIGIVETTYTLGITDEYFDLINLLKN